MKKKVVGKGEGSNKYLAMTYFTNSLCLKEKNETEKVVTV